MEIENIPNDDFLYLLINLSMRISIQHSNN